eukprot:jgi/Ulvmu1/11413/UM075_0075.1
MDSGPMADRMDSDFHKQKQLTISSSLEQLPGVSKTAIAEYLSQRSSSIQGQVQEESHKQAHGKLTAPRHRQRTSRKLAARFWQFYGQLCQTTTKSGWTIES